jgi:hypothetical protein
LEKWTLVLIFKSYIIFLFLNADEFKEEEERSTRLSKADGNLCGLNPKLLLVLWFLDFIICKCYSAISLGFGTTSPPSTIMSSSKLFAIGTHFSGDGLVTFVFFLYFFYFSSSLPSYLMFLLLELLS